MIRRHSGKNPGRRRPLTPENCPACNNPAKPRHTKRNWEHHPYRGHGFAAGQGWSHPDLEPKP